MTSVVVLSVFFLGLTVQPQSVLAFAPSPHSPPSSDKLLEYLFTVANYTTTLQLPTNSLRNASGGTLPGNTDAIFVNGNLARVLLSAHQLQQRYGLPVNPEYLEQGLAWCDTFVELQAEIQSSKGNPAGYWGTGYSGWANCTKPLRGDCAHSGAIYFGDTGTVRSVSFTTYAMLQRHPGTCFRPCLNIVWGSVTRFVELSVVLILQAVTTLAMCHRLARSSVKQATYLIVLEKYATFVLEGSATAPINKKGTVSGFIDSKTGAVGCGYYACGDHTSDNCASTSYPATKLCVSGTRW